MNLAGLDEGAAEGMLAALGSDIPVGRAMAETDGNPLLLRELATSGRQSPTLRQLVDDRFARLDTAAATVLDAAAVAGSRIDPLLLATALGVDVPSILRSLDRAAKAGLVAVPSDEPYAAFVHDVFRSVRYDAIEPWRRVELHAALARALAPRQFDPVVLPELARHACLGATAGDALAAVELAIRAGEEAIRSTDFSGAVAHHRRAVALIDLAAPDNERLRLRTSVSLGRSLVLVGDAEGHAILNRAAGEACRLGDGDALAEALFGMAPIPGATATPGRVDATFVRFVEQALELHPRADHALRVRLLALLGGHLLSGESGVGERGERMVQAAVDRARRWLTPCCSERPSSCGGFAAGRSTWSCAWHAAGNWSISDGQPASACSPSSAGSSCGGATASSATSMRCGRGMRPQRRISMRPISSSVRRSARSLCSAATSVPQSGRLTT